MKLRSIVLALAYSAFSALAQAGPALPIPGAKQAASLPKMAVTMPEASSVAILAVDLTLLLLAVLFIRRRSMRSES